MTPKIPKPPTTHTHHVELDDHEVRKTYVTWDRGEADREWTCLTVLAEHSPGLAPRPVRRELTPDGAPVVVMERLPGAPLGDRPLDAEQTAALAAALRRMWDVPVAHARAAGVRPRLFDSATHASLVSDWLAEPVDLRACQDPARVATAMDAAREWLADPTRRPEPAYTCLGIADLNPANVMWDGTACRLVDFEDGGLSEPAFELADHVEHLAGRRDATYDVAGLMTAVELPEADLDRVRAYRPQWASFWLAMLLPGNGGWHRNPPGTTEWQADHLLALLDVVPK